LGLIALSEGHVRFYRCRSGTGLLEKCPSIDPVIWRCVELLEPCHSLGQSSVLHQLPDVPRGTGLLPVLVTRFSLLAGEELAIEDENESQFQCEIVAQLDGFASVSPDHCRRETEIFWLGECTLLQNCLRSGKLFSGDSCEFSSASIAVGLVSYFDAGCPAHDQWIENVMPTSPAKTADPA
jgi:hypothetical protein